MGDLFFQDCELIHFRYNASRGIANRMNEDMRL